jgi:hypothetical protein
MLNCLEIRIIQHPMRRSSLIRTGLIALIAPICCLPAGQAQT